MALDRWVICAEGTDDPVLFLDSSRDAIEKSFRDQGYEGEISWVAEGGGMWSCELSEDPARHRAVILKRFTHTTKPGPPKPLPGWVRMDDGQLVPIRCFQTP